MAAQQKKAPRFSATVRMSIMVNVPLVGATTYEDALAIANDRGIVKRCLSDDVELVDNDAHEIASVSNDLVWL